MKIPRQAFRPLPPPRRCNDGSKSIRISKEEGFKSRVEELNYKTRPYYFRRCKRVRPTKIKGVEVLNCKTRPYYFWRSERGRPTSIESLPDDLLSEILVRLPADYLCDRVRTVCHRWYRIIHSHEFISKQVQRSSYGLLLHNSYIPKSRPIFVTATQGLIETSEFNYKGRTLFLGSCNGLAMELVSNKGESVHIINPATKQPFTLPSVSLPLVSGREILTTTYGIGYAAASMEYKVVVSYVNNTSSLCLLILTAGVDKCWRYVRVDHVSNSSRLLLAMSPFITEGFMHWTYLSRRDEFLTLNVETEILTVSKVTVPHSPSISGSEPWFSFLSTGRSVTLIFDKGNNIFELWEMNSESGEWTKVADINLNGKLNRSCIDVVLPLGWVKYPEVLALSLPIPRRGTVIFYNLDTQKITAADLPKYGLSYEAIVHKNNLQWLS